MAMGLMKDDNKTKEQLVNELREIHQRVSELELSTTERSQLKELIDSSTDIIGLVDTNGKLLITNKTTTNRFGKSESELLGSIMWELFPPEITKSRKIHFDNVVLTGQPTRFEDENNDTWFDNYYYPLLDKNGAVTSIGIIARDITARKQVENQLIMAEQNFRNSTDNSPLGIRIVDSKGGLIYANQAMLNIYGYTNIDEMRNTPLNKRLTPESYASYLAMGEDATKGKPVPEEQEIEILRKDGEIRNLLAIRREVIWDNEVRFQYLCQDITELKQMEQTREELLNSETELRQSLEDELKKRAEFTRTLVHELKTPLTPMIAASELLLEEAQEGILLKLATSINRSASTMSNRIDTLLDLARGELGTLELDFTTLNPIQLLHKVANDMSLVAEGRELSLSLDVPPSLPLLYGDESRLEQVILNLLINAFKWSSPGTSITLKAKEKGADLVIGVQDEGAGISEEEQERIFEVYYRTEDDRQRVEGLGLGLALCKTIVEAHGGSIWVESQKDKGSTFSFSIPKYRGT